MLLTKLTILAWIIMGIIRQIMDFSQGFYNITLSQVSTKKSTIDQNCLKLDPVHKGYVYNADQLKHIKNRVDHDRKLRILDYKSCVNIRKFRINRKKTRRGRKVGNVKCYESKPRWSVNFDNLILIAQIQESKITKFTKQLKFVTLNAQSIKYKDQLIVDYLLNEHIDVAIITETWLKDTNDMWLQGCELNKNSYKITSSNRKKQAGRRSSTSI